jgi:hypothetical protein
MPRCVLNHFVNEYKSFYYFDINETNKKLKIKIGHPKSLNTEYGYYSAEIEYKLHKFIETPLGSKIAYIKSNDFSSPTDVPKDFRNIALTYIHSLIARAPHMYSILEKHSLMLSQINDLTETKKNDLAVELVMKEAEKNSPFANYIITMVVNNTSVPFVLPTGGMYSYGEFICAPVSTYRAIALVKSGTKLGNSLLYGDLCKVLIVENEPVLHRMNLFAIQSEVINNKQYVVSCQKELLENYLKELTLI